MEFQSFLPEDIPALPALQPESWLPVTPHFHFYLRHAFCHPLKLVSDGKLVATGCWIQHEHTAWLAHILVEPGHHRQGIGGRMTRELMAQAQSAGCRSLLLIATDMGYPLYLKLGFWVEEEYLFYRELKPDSTSAPDACLLPFADRWEEKLWRLDKETSGEERAGHLHMYLHNAWIYAVNEQLEGYYLPDCGEGHIVAVTERAGLALVRLRLQAKDIACFPRSNKVLTDWMRQQGYEPFRIANRMAYGDPVPHQLSHIYQRIGGNLG